MSLPSFVVLATVIFLATQFDPALPAGGAAGSSAPAHYSADSITLLFDNFDGSHQGVAASAGISYETGYLSGNAVRFPDTMSFIRYSEGFWQPNGEDDFQESGTIEFYYRPETFIYSGARPYGMLFTIGERSTFPNFGEPNLSVFEDGQLRWEIARSPTGITYNTAAANDPPLYPGQWYHVAATWSGKNIFLYRNGTLVGNGTSDSFVLADTFLLGATGVLPLAQGIGVQARFDRLRISNRARSADELPSAMDVRIDSPVNGEDLTPPFPVAYRAFESVYRSRLVDLGVDTNSSGFDGIVMARNLPESGVVLTGAGIPDGTFYVYAIAHSGEDSAFFYTASPIHVTASTQYSMITDPLDTTATVANVPTTGDSFVLILLNGGGITSGSLTASADSIGTNANYSIAARLLQAADSVRIFIWTTETAPSILLGVRSDTGNLSATLPAGIPNSELGRATFGATVVSLEFLRSNGSMIGDTTSTHLLRDTFSYSLEYQLSAATASAYQSLGFDLSPGSGSFAFYFSDTYGSPWIWDSSVMVSVLAGSGGGILVRVAGITRDLPGGLGMAPNGGVVLNQVDEPGFCILYHMGLAGWALEFLRALRDFIMSLALGRWATEIYYTL